MVTAGTATTGTHTADQTDANTNSYHNVNSIDGPEREEVAGLCAVCCIDVGVFILDLVVVAVRPYIATNEPAEDEESDETLDEAEALLPSTGLFLLTAVLTASAATTCLHTPDYRERKSLV